MRRPSRPNYNQHHQSIFVNRHISHAIQRFSRQTTSQKAIPGQGTPLKLPSYLESIFSYPNCRNESSSPVSKAISPQTISKTQINSPTQNITLPKHYSPRYTTNLSWQ